MKLAGFVGPSADTRSRTFNHERTINFYLEQKDAGNPRSDWALYGTPGTRVFAAFSDGEGRGLFAQDGRAFGVSGTLFGELTSAGTITNTGTVTAGTTPATFSSNGEGGFQVFVTAGGNGYVFDLLTNVLTLIADGDFPADVTQGCYFEGYSVALVANSTEFHTSALMDTTDWDPLDVYQRNLGSDNFVAMVPNHRELWFFGTRTSLVYVNTGDASTPLQPIPGVMVQQGCLAQYSAVRIDNAIAWLGQDEHGQAIVYRTNGYTPERISTYPIEHYLNQSADLTVAVGFSLQMEGHLWYGLHVPDLETTLMYDVSTGQWCEWALWNINTAEYEPHPAMSACAVFDEILVQDYRNQGVYRLAMDAYDNELVA